MKLRSGFVSNSSTSSFIMVGVTLNKKELHELLKMEDGDDWYEAGEKAKLDIYSDAADTYYVGKNLTSMEGDECTFDQDISVLVKNLSRLVEEVAGKLGVPQSTIRLISATVPS